MRPQLSRCLIVLVGVGALACSSGSGPGPGSGGEVVVTGAVAADAIGQASRIGSYDIEATEVGEMIAVYDLEGVLVAQVVVMLQTGGGLHYTLGPAPDSDLEPASAFVRTASLDEHDGVYAQFFFESIAASGPYANFGFVVTGSGEPGEGWVDSVTFQVQVRNDRGNPPASGGSLPDTPTSTLLTLPIIEGGTSVTTIGEIAAWLSAADVAEIASDRAFAILLGVLFDRTLAAELDERATAAEEAAMGSGLGTQGQAIHLGPLCEDALDAIPLVPCATECFADNSDRLPEELDPAVRSLGRVLTPDCVHCMFLMAPEIHRRDECLRSAQNAVDDAWCVLNDRGCLATPGALPVPAHSEHSCECRCNPLQCEGYCGQFAAYLSQTGGPRCQDRLVCDCGWNGDTWCASRWAEAYCGGATFLGPRVGFDCVTASCGDGEIARDCTFNPDLVEDCDASSSSEGDTCPDGFECVNCRCEPCADSVMCGDGRISTHCPEYREECDPAATPTGCAAGERCEFCGCVGEDGGGGCVANGRIDPGEECDPLAAGACGANESCVDCRCVDVGPGPDAGPDVPPTGDVIGSCVGYDPDTGAPANCMTWGGTLLPGIDETTFSQSVCYAPQVWLSGSECPLGHFGECRYSDPNIQWSNFFYYDIDSSSEQQATLCAAARSACESDGAVWFGPSC